LSKRTSKAGFAIDLQKIGSGSVVALLKALYASFIAPTPAGTNVIGGVTVADGSNSAEGAKADAAYADSTGAASGSIVALLKGAYVGLKGVLTVGGNIASGSADSGNPVKIGGKYNSAPGSLSDGQRGDAQLDLKGSLKTTLFAADQANAITTATVAADGVSTGSFGLAMRGFSHIFNGTTWDRAKKAVSTSRIPSAANTTNATSAKASAGELHKASAYNATASLKYLKIYNKASAPTVGSDTPVLTLPIPPNGTLNHDFPNGGFYFATGIAYALTGAAADADSTALAANDVVGVNIVYS
jgi:hypothetical protein